MLSISLVATQVAAEAEDVDVRVHIDSSMVADRG